jgi:hypothetical protein
MSVLFVNCVFTVNHHTDTTRHELSKQTIVFHDDRPRTTCQLVGYVHMEEQVHPLILK